MIYIIIDCPAQTSINEKIINQRSRQVIQETIHLTFLQLTIRSPAFSVPRFHQSAFIIVSDNFQTIPA
jgi:hypothetical protein